MLLLLSSCWDRPGRTRAPNQWVSVWGNKPVYAARNDAKLVTYVDSAQPVVIPGNIYAKGSFINQLETGRGIHVIDNSTPAQARRIGFITVNGSSQISIRDQYLYTNNYEDLIVIDLTDPSNLQVVKRVAGAFPEAENNYFYAFPVESGYYECPRYDSVVIGWVKDTIWTNCIKE